MRAFLQTEYLEVVLETDVPTNPYPSIVQYEDQFFVLIGEGISDDCLIYRQVECWVIE